MRPAILAAAFALATAPAANATTLGTLVVDGPPVSGDVSVPGPQKWSLYLVKGRDYALTGDPVNPGSLSVHAPGGATVASGVFFLDDGSNGFAFRVPATATYTVQVACLPNGTCPGSYDLWALSDCARGVSTTCRIAPGGTLRGQTLFEEDDVDWVRTSLRAGRRYRVAVAATDGYPTAQLCLAVRDSRGRVVASAPGYCDGPFSVDFAPKASGTYFLEVAGGGTGASGNYQLSVTAR